MAILNFSKSPEHFQMVGKVIVQGELFLFCVTKNEVDPWRLFWISVKALKKSPAHLLIVGNVIIKFE